MDKRIKESNLEVDLKTIVEWEIDSAKEEGIDDNSFEEHFKHLDLRSNHDPSPKFRNLNKVDWNHFTFEDQKVCSNIFGTRTYTSPVSFDSSTENSAPNNDEFLLEANYNIRLPMTKTRNSNSIATRLRSDKWSEKFTMLRNIVENIECPLKRKMLLEFIDNSTLKTQYLTIKESSSSGEEAKRLFGISKRRRKSPLSVIPKSRLYYKGRNINAYSQERKRFSLARPRGRTVITQEQYGHNFAIEKKDISEEVDSRNDDKCYTEASREVPLEVILNKITCYQNPFQPASRGKSGHSCPQEELVVTKVEDGEEYVNIDLEANIGAKESKKYKEKEIIILSNDLIESNQNTGEKVNSKSIKLWSNRIRYIMFIFLILAVIGLTIRTVYLEIELHTHNNEIYELGQEINDLQKLNLEWQAKYNKWSSGQGTIGSTSNEDNLSSNFSSSVYAGISP